MSDEISGQEVIREIDQRLSPDDRVSEDLSFADDEVFNEFLQNISDELPTSTELFEGHKATREMIGYQRDDWIEESGLKELFCTSGRRFETGLGLNAIRADVINFQPVSSKLEILKVCRVDSS